jgi:outer membrane protein assembly factor BamB
MLKRTAFCTGLLALSLTNTVQASPWDMFRGSNGLGIGDKLNLPEQITVENAAWSVPFGKGASSLVLREQNLFVTSMENDARHLHCLNAKDGSESWKLSINKIRDEVATPPNGPAMCTPACDDKVVVALFPDSGLLASSLDGTMVWQKDLGPFYSMHGISASPIIVDQSVIVVADQLQSPFIAAFELASGTERWRKDRPLGITGGYSTPTIMSLADRKILITAAPGMLIGYDASTGDELFSMEGFSNAPVSTPVVVDDLIYYTEPPGQPLPFEAMAGADRNGDKIIELTEVSGALGTYRLMERVDQGFGNKDGRVTRMEWDRCFHSMVGKGGMTCAKVTHENGKFTCESVWTETKSSPYIPSVLVHGERLFAINDGGVLAVFDRMSGELQSRKRLRSTTGQFYASPIADESTLIVANTDGKVSFIDLANDLNTITSVDLKESVIATPSLHQGQLFVRTEQSIYCFGSSKS